MPPTPQDAAPERGVGPGGEPNEAAAPHHPALRAALALGAIGDRPTDSEAQRLKHSLLVYMGVLMSVGGLVWGTLGLVNGFPAAAAIPYGYGVLTAINLLVFRATGNFRAVRFFQVSISLLLPFALQWVLGGFAASGAVMLWSMLSLVGSLAFSETTSVLRWLVVYAVLTIGTGLADAYLRTHFVAVTDHDVRTLFFVLNIVFISCVVFGLTIYLLRRQEIAQEALAAANARMNLLNTDLEAQVRERTLALEASLAQSRAVLNNMPDGLFAVDTTGIIRAANPQVSAMVELGDELVGQRAHDALPEALYRLAVETATHDRAGHVDLARGDRTLLAKASPIHELQDGVERCVGAVVIVRDVTLEREIDRMKTDFIATVSHELRTPLTSVLGFAKITRNKLDNTLTPALPTDDKKVTRALKQVGSNLDIIISEGGRLTSLISDVLDISKMEAGRMEWKMAPFAPAELLARSIEATTSLFGDGAVELRSEIEQDLPELHGDFDRLMQVVINLISNAAKFTAQGRVVVAARRTRQGVEFSVTDSGEGIAPHAQEQIFLKFRQVGDTLTAKPMGTGLGLPISQQIAAAHGTEITVRSRLGAGARFAFALSATGAMEPRPPGRVETLVHHLSAHVAEHHPASDACVLIVDDDESLRELLRQQLEERGYRTLQAADGYAAIDLVRARRPDLVLLDIMMPGISGFDVAAVLKSDPSTQTIPVLVLSIIEDAERGAQIGVDSHVTKPHQADDLIGEIERLLHGVRAHSKVLMVMDGGRNESEDSA